MSSNFVVKVSALMIGIIIVGSSFADSKLPDTDNTQFNNSFEKAENLGLIGKIGPDGKPISISRDGELGQVLGGFDSRDFLKFQLPNNLFTVQIRSAESPITTSWVRFYDGKRKLLYESKGNDNEDFSVILGEGEYFAEIITDNTTSGGRLLKYRLEIKPEIQKLPVIGGFVCDDAPDYGDILSNKIQLSTHVDQKRPAATFRFYIREGARLDGMASGLLHVDKLVYDLAAKRPINFQTSPGVNPNQGIAILDPGYYCVAVFLPGHPPHIPLGAIPATPTHNFNLQLSAKNLRTSNPPPQPNPQFPYWLVNLDLGTSTQNGDYIGTRYPNFYGNPALTLGKQYVIREWIDQAFATKYYFFKLAADTELDAQLDKHSQPLGAVILDSNGAIVAGLATSNPTNGNGTYLPTLSVKKTLPAGSYFVRIQYLTGNTSFQLQIKGITASNFSEFKSK